MQRLLPFVLMALALSSPSTASVPDTLTVTFFDVGKGDAILV